jgi:hypothetical protein
MLKGSSRLISWKIGSDMESAPHDSRAVDRYVPKKRGGKRAATFPKEADLEISARPLSAALIEIHVCNFDVLYPRRTETKFDGRSQFCCSLSCQNTRLFFDWIFSCVRGE